MYLSQLKIKLTVYWIILSVYQYASRSTSLTYVLHQQVSNTKICEDPTSTRQLLLLGSAVERRWWWRSSQRCCETSWSVRTKTYIQELSLRQTAWYVHESVCSLLLHIAKRLIDIAERSTTRRCPQRNEKKNIKMFAHCIKSLDLFQKPAKHPSSSAKTRRCFSYI